MRPDLAVIALTLLGAASASAIENLGSQEVARAQVFEKPRSEDGENLWKRKGGGGGGGRGGGGGGGGSSSGGGGSSSGGGGSSGGRPGGSTGGGGGGGVTAGRGGGQDNKGGSTRTGSGPAPAYGRGQYYGGGARVPYIAGSRSPLAGIAPFFLVGAALAFWPGLWLYGAHVYPYYSPYRYYNQTAAENQTKAILCGCDPHLPCGCDENNDTEYLASLIGTGALSQLNTSLINVGEYEGNLTLFINGSLPNGTTAAGGDEEIDSAAGAALRGMAQQAGYWPMVVAVIGAVLLV